MGRIALVVTAVLAGIAGISTYQAATANQQIGVLESGLATVAGQYNNVKAKYTKLDQLMLKREEAKGRDKQHQATRTNAINTLKAGECLDSAVPSDAIDILRARPGDRARLSSSASGANPGSTRAEVAETGELARTFDLYRAVTGRAAAVQ